MSLATPPIPSGGVAQKSIMNKTLEEKKPEDIPEHTFKTNGRHCER
jgi:hypothetical protein